MSLDSKKAGYWIPFGPRSQSGVVLERLSGSVSARHFKTGVGHNLEFAWSPGGSRGELPPRLAAQKPRIPSDATSRLIRDGNQVEGLHVNGSGKIYRQQPACSGSRWMEPPRGDIRDDTPSRGDGPAMHRDGTDGESDLRSRNDHRPSHIVVEQPCLHAPWIEQQCQPLSIGRPKLLLHKRPFDGDAISLKRNGGQHLAAGR
jgi:hypothetical protein